MTKRTATAAAAATAAVTQPRGFRQFAGGCLVVLLMGVLVMGGFVAAAWWWATRPPEALACPPGSVTVAPASEANKPSKATMAAVVAAVHSSGRDAKVSSEAASADIRVVRATDPKTVAQVYGDQPISLRIGEDVTSGQVVAALGSDRLADCGTVPAPPVTDWRPAISWPTSPIHTGLTVVVLGWWAVGPVVLRLVAWASWPVRYCWRRLERAWWVWRRRHGWADPMALGQRPARGERWKIDEAGLRDPRGPRAQDRAAGRHWDTVWSLIRDEIRTRRRRKSKQMEGIA